MNVYRYTSLGGKDLIIHFIDTLSLDEKAEGYFLLEHLERIHSLQDCLFATRKIQGKL